MKNKLFLFLFLLSLKSFSQSSNVQSASNSFKSYERAGVDKKLREITEAKKFIDIASTDASTANDPKMWYYRGKIYFAISSDSVPGIKDLDNDAAEKSSASFINCLKTDTKKLYTDEVNDLIWVSGVGLFNAAAEAFNKNDFDKAEKYYNEIFEIIPLDKNNNLRNNNITVDVINMNLYLLYKKAKNIDKQKIYLQKMIDAKNNDAAIYLNMSRIYLEEKDTTKALTYIEQGRKLFEENPKLINEELNIYILQGKTDILATKLTEAITSNPNNEQLYFNRGIIYKERNELEKTIEDFKKALNLKPDYFDANYELGAIYFNQAGELVKKADKIPPEKTKEYNEAKAKAEAKFKEAQPFLEKAYQLNPKDVNTINSLKQLYARVGDLKKAEEMKKVLEELKK